MNVFAIYLLWSVHEPLGKIQHLGNREHVEMWSTKTANPWSKIHATTDVKAKMAMFDSLNSP
jgi:hypothetical protein